jgi:paxillin
MEAYFNTVLGFDFLAGFRKPEESKSDKKLENLHTCAGCEQDAEESEVFFIDALAKHFHPDCFKCFKCNCTFSTRNPFIPYQGKAFCEKDFVQSGVICHACNFPIKGRSLLALEKNWHPEHFTCTDCKKPLSSGFFEHQGQVYCEKHYQRKAIKCQICNHSIGTSPSVPGSNGLIHKSCLTCSFGHGKCNASSSSKFYVLDSRPICEYHFHVEKKTLCPACDTGIDGYCAEVDPDTRFHRECWTCAACNCFLEGSYYIYMGGAYCEKDINRLTPNSSSVKKRTTLIYNTLDRREKDDLYRDSVYSRY